VSRVSSSKAQYRQPAIITAVTAANPQPGAPAIERPCSTADTAASSAAVHEAAGVLMIQ